MRPSVISHFILIQPHEDGPSYHPVVATLSLGSHAVFNYHRYLNEQETLSNTSPEATAETSRTSAGRAIDPTPVLSLLLEPRSLVITAKELYTRHLHAIEPLERDVLAPHGSYPDDTWECDDQRGHHAVKVANWQMLKGEKERLAAREGGVLERKTRISLTCRDVEKVLGGKGFGNAFL